MPCEGSATWEKTKGSLSVTHSSASHTAASRTHRIWVAYADLPFRWNEPDVPDGVGMNDFRDVQFFGEVLEPIFHGPAAEPPGCSPVGP